MRDVINRVLDMISPPTVPKQSVRARCPSCGEDLWKRNLEFRDDLDRDLTFVRCVCGRPSAWFVNGHGPQLIYTDQPEECEDGDDGDE